jgi:hypothetical protein
MDISGASDQTNSVMNFADNWNASSHASNVVNNDKYNSAINNAKTKQGIWKGYDEGSSAVSGTQAVLTGAKVYGDAKNFDSDIAGFGAGKGASGYLSGFTQQQLLKGRYAQAGQKVKVATGMMETADVAKSGAQLGLKKSVPGMMTQLSRPSATAPLTSKQVPTGKSVGVGADVSAIADESEAGKAVAKASGGLLTKAGGAEGGVAGSVIKKVGKFASDMPEGQLSAVSDIAGKGLGLFGAGRAIYADTQGDWKHDTAWQKASNIGDIVAGGIDALSMAIPVLAPVGAVASAVSAGLDIGAEADTYKEDVKKAQGLKQTGSTASEQAPSLSSAGLVAKQQLTSY